LGFEIENEFEPMIKKRMMSSIKSLKQWF